MGSMEDTSRKTGEILERLAQQQEKFNKSIDKLTKEGDKAMHRGGGYVSENCFKSGINCFM